MSPPLSLTPSAYLISIPRRSLLSWVRDNLDGYTVEHDGLCITVPHFLVSLCRALLMHVLPAGFLRSELRGSEWQLGRIRESLSLPFTLRSPLPILAQFPGDILSFFEGPNR